MPARPVALLRSLALLAGLVLAACGGTPPQPADPAALAIAPAGSGPPLVLGRMRTPAYARERPQGDVAFVVDSGLGSVYEFDLRLRRFLGPAPLLTGIGRMPAYPTVLGDFAPQGAAVIDGALYVADGDDGSVAHLAATPAGLGPAGYIQMPAFTLSLPPSEGGGVAPTASRFLDLLAPLGDGAILVLGKDRVDGIGIAYAVDARDGTVTGTLQLPAGYPQAAAHAAGRTVVAMDGKRLLVVAGQPLRIVETIQLGGVPHGIAVVDRWAFVALDSPARLVKVDLASGVASTVDSVAPSPGSSSISQQTGPVQTDGNVVWWTIKTGEIRQVSVLTGVHGRSFETCRYVNGLAHAGAVLLATCLDHAQLALVDLRTGSVERTRAGYFPSAVVVAAS